VLASPGRALWISLKDILAFRQTVAMALEMMLAVLEFSDR